MANDNSNVEALRDNNPLDMTNPEELQSLNGFIGPDPHETFHRVGCAIEFVQNLEVLRAEVSKNPAILQLSSDGQFAFHLMLDCARAALDRQEKLMIEGARK